MAQRSTEAPDVAVLQPTTMWNGPPPVIVSISSTGFSIEFEGTRVPMSTTEHALASIVQRTSDGLRVEVSTETIDNMLLVASWAIAGVLPVFAAMAGAVIAATFTYVEISLPLAKNDRAQIVTAKDARDL